MIWSAHSTMSVPPPMHQPCTAAMVGFFAYQSFMYVSTKRPIMRKSATESHARLPAGACSTDNEFVKLAWRREHKGLDRLGIWQFADTNGSLVDGLGVRSPDGVAYRATFIVDPEGVIQHVYVTNLDVGRNPQDTLRVLDALQTGELCPCNREVGGSTLKVAA